MANGSKIVITAGLQVPETVHNIQDELNKQVAPNLKLEIACNIKSDSLAAIQEQISKLSEGLTINLNNANIRQAKVEIIPDIKKGVLEDQAKRLEKELGLSFSYGSTTKLREELMGLLNSYQKAYQAEGAYGEQAEDKKKKIIDFARQYQQENVLINETLKAEQERIKEIRAEQQKVFITADQMNAISTEARKQGTSAQAILNSQLPNGWYSNPNKIPAGGKPYYWSDYVNEINNINPFHQIVSSENDILQAMSDISEFMSKSFTTIDDSIEKNENELRMWVETVKGAVGDVTGKNPYSGFFDDFVDLIPDEEVNKIKQESQTIQNSISGISASMQSLSGETGTGMRMSINAQAIDEFISELNKLGVQGVNLDELRSRFENLDISIDKISSSFSKLDNGTEYLSQVTIRGKDTFGSLVDYTEKYEYSVEEAQTKFSSATTKITENFERIRAAEEKMRAETDTAQKSLNKFLTLQGKFDFFAKQYGNVSSLEPQFAEISELISKFDNTAPIENQQEAIIRLDNALKLLKIDIDEINRANGEATVTSQEALDAMTAKQLHLRQQYEKLEASITKAGLSMDAIATRDGTNYRTIFTDIIDGAVTSTAQLKKASDALTTIRNEFQIANAQTVSTLPQTAIENFAANVIKLRTQFRSLSTDYSDIKDKSVELSGKFNELTEAIKPFENFDKATIDSKERLKELVAAFTNARTLLVEVKAETANVIKEQTKQEAEYKKLTSSLNEYIAALEKFNNSSVAKNNTSNIAVSSQLGLNTNLAEQLRAFQESLANDKSPENVNRIRQRIDELSSSLEAARWNSSYLIESLENSNADAKLTSQIRNLTNQVEAYANANKEAVESQRKMRSGVTFADEFQRIINALKNGNLDNNAIRRLKEDFANFKGEARSVGLTTNRLFTNMGNQLKMIVSRWFSLYAIISKIRTMINYVIQLDDAMTKLKRVTDETAAGYEHFLEVAKESAKETNTTLVDTVEQAAKWAKSGYDAATSAELAKTSLIYSIVGDIDNDTAVSDLVTALRGFRLEAEDAISVVDKLDALNNKYATDAKSLGEGLRVSASAMAAANNDIDQTLALLTGATEITQNAQETGQAIKTITMRLRGKFYASIWGNSYAMK